MGRRGHPPGFRREVLDPVEAGRPVADVARDLGGGAESIRTWRRQDRIDEGRQPGLRSAEEAGPTAARRRIAEPGAELVIHRRASELRAGVVPHTRRRRGSRASRAARIPRAATCSRRGRPRPRPLEQVRCRFRATGGPEAR